MSKTAKYRRVPLSFWKDRRVMGLSPDERALAFYCRTYPHNHIGGCFSPALAAEHLGWAPEEFNECFSRVVRAMGWSYDNNLLTAKP